MVNSSLMIQPRQNMRSYALRPHMPLSSSHKSLALILDIPVCDEVTIFLSCPSQGLSALSVPRFPAEVSPLPRLWLPFWDTPTKSHASRTTTRLAASAQSLLFLQIPQTVLPAEPAPSVCDPFRCERPWEEVFQRTRR